MARPSSGLDRISVKAAAMASAAMGTTRAAPASPASGKLHPSVMTHGSPAAIASSTAMLKPSEYVGATKTLAAASAPRLSDPPSIPVKVTASSTPAARK